ncbi:MAG: hypothetical protein WCV99_19730, partial [Sterolibacterium sp.]
FVNTSAARFVFLAMITPVKSCTRIMTIIGYFVTLLMERTTSPQVFRCVTPRGLMGGNFAPGSRDTP